jgi:hypothetical protein
MQLVLLLLVLAAVCSLAAPLSVSYSTPDTPSSFVFYEPSVPVRNISRGLTQTRAPFGTAVFGNSSQRLLSTSKDNQLCEWDLSLGLSAPFRCVALPVTSVPRDLVYMPHPHYPYILVSVPNENLVLGVYYIDFSVDTTPWFSVAQHPSFLAPVALEYDSVTDYVYVALEGSDSIMQFDSDGVLLQASWQRVPRPRFLQLDRDVQPASLFCLTADLSLPELYQFRLSDAANLGTVANLDGSWFPDDASISGDDSVRSISVSHGALYALWHHEDSVSAFSMRDASEIISLPNPQLRALQGLFLDPVALLRQETQGHNDIMGVVDVKSWFSLSQNTTSYQHFEACVPGLASGDTLKHVHSVQLCPNGQNDTDSILLVTDARSVYRLKYSGIGTLCFQDYVISPSEGWNISDSALDVAGQLLVSVPEDRRRIWLVPNACNATAQSPRVLESHTMDPCAGCNYFSPAREILCQLNVVRNHTVTCSNGIMLPLKLGGERVSVLSSSFSNEVLWIALTNGTVISFSWPNFEFFSQDDPVSAVNCTFLGFTMDRATGGPVWLLSNDSLVPVYMWTSSPAIPSFLISRVGVVQRRRQFMMSPLSVPLVSQWAIPYVSPTPYPTHGGPMDPALIAMIILVCLMCGSVCLGCWVCCCRNRCCRRQKDGANIHYSNLDDGQDRVPNNGTLPHIRRFKWARDFVRQCCCFCRCCYDPNTGTIRFGHYYLGGKPLAPRGAQELNESLLQPPSASSTATPFDEPAASPQGAYVISDDPVDGGEPLFSASGASLHSIPLEGGRAGT